MQISAIKRTTRAKNVVVDKNSVIMVYPSDNEKIWNTIYKLNILNNNNYGMVVPNRVYTLLKKRFNGRIHFLDCKKNLTEKSDAGKKIRVFPTFSSFGNPDKEKINQHRFVYYDLSMLNQAVSYFYNREGFSERRVFGLFINELQNEYKYVSETNPNKKILTVFHVTNHNDFVYNFLVDFKRIRSLMKQELAVSPLCDDYLYVAVADRFFPVLERDYKKNEYNPIIPQISYMEALVSALETTGEINNTQAITPHETDDEVENQISNNDNIVNKIVSALTDKTYKLSNTDNKNKSKISVVQNKPLEIKATVEDDKIDITVDNVQLTKVLKTFKINNADVIANVRTAIDSYVKEHKDLPSKMKAEELILKSINYMIHGTDIIDPAYLTNPALLFAKLKNIDSFSVPLEFPKDLPNLPFNPSDIITIDKVTGQHRQKYEFDTLIHENIKQVFGILEEQKKHPIKVLSIDWDYLDTEADRVIEYTIMLQNMDGNKAKYPIKLQVPSILNEKYFKLGGNKYIFSSQQHLKCLTKTQSNDVRILTNYAIIRLSVENMKFNMADVNDILRYIEQRYPNLLTEADENSAKFNDGSQIFFTGNNVFKDIDHNVVIDTDTNKLIDLQHESFPLKQNRFEYLFDVILNKIHTVNPDDNLTKTKKSIPYIALFLSGVKIPFIIFMWSQKGLLSTLNTFGIDYEITEDPGEKGDIFLSLANGKYLILRPSNTREKLIANGLLVNKVKYPIQNLDSPEEIRTHISDIYGSRFNFLIDNIVQNLIDPKSKELLEFDNYPTNLPGLLSGPALDMLLNQKPSALSDLRIYRSRMSEIMLRIMYKQLTRAFNSYMHKVEFGDENAKLQIIDRYIVNEFLGRNPPSESQERSAVMSIELTSAVNPIDELMLASKVIKTGPGGLRTKDEFKPAHRNVHTYLDVHKINKFDSYISSKQKK